MAIIYGDSTFPRSTFPRRLLSVDYSAQCTWAGVLLSARQLSA